ncbi:MAG: ATP-binding protein [Lachnospiraceae bacterium]|nr:ATP-binding protein [Lachnospiraceae bacterium]
MEQWERSWQQICAMKKEDYILIDIRDELSFSYGNIPGSINITEEMLLADAEKWRPKTVILCCKKGQSSLALATRLREAGWDAYSLQGGYLAWLMQKMQEEEQTPEITTFDIEQSLRKKFKKSIWSKFTKAVRDYELVQEGDRIAVCISGGKDSMLMAKLFQELQRHHKVEFELVFLVMDPGYSAANRQIIENNAKKLGIPITIFESDIFDAVFEIEKSPCYLCARMRRGHLYHQAKQLGCNKIALGHHYDDVIETILMGMLYGAQMQTMMPKLHSTNFEGMELIRPLYLVREDDIKKWRDYNNLYFLQCACKFTETCSSCQDNGQNNSKRLEVKNLIREMKKTNPYVEGNIFKSVENVNLSTIIAYKKDGVKHHFLETYDEKTNTEELPSDAE